MRNSVSRPAGVPGPVGQLGRPVSEFRSLWASTFHGYLRREAGKACCIADKIDEMSSQKTRPHGYGRRLPHCQCLG
jgi:hypothetical protein